jgi:hypothetical protein
VAQPGRALGSGPRGRRFKSYRPDFPNQQLRGGQRGRLFVYTRFHTRVVYRLAYFFTLSYTFFDARFFSFPADCGIQRTDNGAKANLSILRDALRMQPEQFRAKLEKFLAENGFTL